jgi:anti-sigma regulatory factor (Ser/Thr protein kinase)
LSGEVKLTIALEIVSRLDQVRLVRAALSGVLNHLRVEEADIIALELAVTEIVNNTVEHGYDGVEDQQIKVRIEVQGLLVRVIVTDHGKPFPEQERYRLVQPIDPLEEADEDWSPRGHGLQIVRQIVDSLEIECGAQENIFTLSKTVALRTD